MRVTVYGPNVRFDDGVEMHVHRADCHDLTRTPYRQIRPGSDQGGWSIDAESHQAIVEDVYGDMIAENDGATWRDYAEHVHIFPCVTLPADAPRYVATINVPGYLPMDDDPPIFDDARSAWDYLHGERETAEDDFTPEGEDYTQTRETLATLATTAHWMHPSSRAEWLAEYGLDPQGCGTIYGDTPGYDGSHDLGLAYSVTIVDEA